MIKFLLDTNVFLWCFWDSERIKPIKGLINAKESDVYISMVSFWEISIKIRTGKLNIDIDKLRLFAQKYAFYELPITGDFFKAYLELPKLHKDPFDHMLIAQAITCPMHLITSDSILADYSSLVMVI